MTGPTTAEFIDAFRKTRDPNWSDIQHLMALVWVGEVGAMPKDDTAARNAMANNRHAFEIADIMRNQERG